MTSPEQPPEEIPPPDEPQSPQAVAVDEAMEQAESSIIPVIATLIAAEVAMSTMPDLPHVGLTDLGELDILHKTVAFMVYPFGNAATARRGLYHVLRGGIEALLAPLGVFAWKTANEHSDSPETYTEKTYEAITETIDEVVDRVTKSVEHVLAKDQWDDQDFYALFGTPSARFHAEWTGDDEFHGDPRSITQKWVDNFARQMARWLTRETVFSIQERVAGAMGFTHKRWITMHDHRVRDSHRPLHGRAVPIGTKFTTPVGKLRYPGDTSAPIGLWINCRCVIEWIAR